MGKFMLRANPQKNSAVKITANPAHVATANLSAGRPVSQISPTCRHNGDFGRQRWRITTCFQSHINGRINYIILDPPGRALLPAGGPLQMISFRDETCHRLASHPAREGAVFIWAIFLSGNPLIAGDEQGMVSCFRGGNEIYVHGPIHEFVPFYFAIAVQVSCDTVGRPILGCQNPCSCCEVVQSRQVPMDFLSTFRSFRSMPINFHIGRQ